MKSDAHGLIEGYLDDTLSEEQFAQLSDWLRADAEHAKIFAKAVWLHDRIQSSLAARSTLEQSTHLDSAVPGSVLVAAWQRVTSFTALHWGTAASVGAVLVCVALLWFSPAPSSAVAAVRELDRIIETSLRSQDRTYTIVVEQTVKSVDRGKAVNESQRPPKPPLDGAMLYLREGERFVLVRQTNEGMSFITGSNGSQSWAVNTRGPVRVSSDVHHFDHDLPGHETSIPLTNIHEGLERLKQSYDLQFSTAGPEEYQSQGDANIRLLMAVKKPKIRGPQRVEIAYDSTSGRILHMRFIQMPYGPDRLDLRLSLVNENDLPLDFFEHSSHHTLDRRVETEN